MLDLYSLIDGVEVTIVAETFARLACRSMEGADERKTVAAVIGWAEQDARSLRTRENEVFIEHGRRMIPRLLPWKEANDRLNSHRRIVTRETSTVDSCVEIIRNESAGLYEAKLDEAVCGSRTATASSCIATHFASALPFAGDRFVCVGRSSEDDLLKAALSSKNASIVIPLSLDVGKGTGVSDIEGLGEGSQSGVDPGEKAASLAALISRYLTALAVRNSHGGVGSHRDGGYAQQTYLFIGPDELSERCIRQVFDERGLAYRIFTTDVEQFAARAGSKDSVHLMHLRFTARELKAMFPPGQGHVYSFLSDTAEFKELHKNLKDITELGSHSNGEQSSFSSSTTLYQYHTLVHGADDRNDSHWAISSWMWKKAVHLACSELAAQLGLGTGKLRPMRVMPVLELLQTPTRSPTGHLAIWDWSRTTSLPQMIQPYSQRLKTVAKPLLSPDKVYIMAGLTRDVGYSLCELFASLGGRRFFLISRHPPTEPPQWQLYLWRRGIDSPTTPLPT